MKFKEVLENISALLALIFTGISTGTAGLLYLMEVMPLMEQSEVPENPVGIIILPFFLAILSISFSIIFAFFLFTKRKKVSVSYLFFEKGERKICIITRALCYLFILRIIYEFVRDLITYKDYIKLCVDFYSSIISYILMGMIIFISVIAKKDSDFE